MKMQLVWVDDNTIELVVDKTVIIICGNYHEGCNIEIPGAGISVGSQDNDYKGFETVEFTVQSTRRLT